MKIVDVKMAVMGTAWRNLTFVRVLTDEGVEGVGEVRMLNHTDALLGYFAEAVPNHILGHDPTNIEDLVHRMYMNDYARAGEIAMSAIATIEIACWDIMGKLLAQPIYKLLGGAVRDKIKAYANGWYTVERTPQEFHAALRVIERGYRALKLDPFGSGFYELDRNEKLQAVALVEAVRDAIGPDAELLVEMHGRFNPATAIEMARELEPFSPSWIEEPVPRRIWQPSRKLPKGSMSRWRPASASIHATITASFLSYKPPTLSSLISPISVACSKQRSLLPGPKPITC